MAVRKADAVWRGDLKDGSGSVKLGSGAFEGGYTYASRFEEGSGTNPEELIGAAHAGCFTMFLSGVLSKAGHAPVELATTASVHLDEGRIHTIELQTEGSVPGIDEAAFRQYAEEAKANCPVSKLVTGAQVRVNASLRG